ncbi:MAG TPA: recombinase family protein [Blastocatellia bacterium]|nr:recombinase family protein [Blastocatellia bacterium]
MILNPYFSYIRVSTLRQGQTGTSLSEQQGAINRYAERSGFTIIAEYEEKETAAKLGRPVFNDMLKALKAGKAKGVIIHKIDRSARNLQDWVHLQELIDNGIEIHFANESIDLQSRGGRLSADIQAVVAADYIRNLREETKKGFYGRLKQGLYPRPAPIGYIDCGKGQPKKIDSVRGPLVRRAFELYATGDWGLDSLKEYLTEIGLRTKSGKFITRHGLATLLHNPFYCGLIRIKIRGELFQGQHEPLIPKSLFDQVQDVCSGKRNDKKQKHHFLWRTLITCSQCQTKLIGEKQKGYRYYRCHTKGCSQKPLREDIIEAQFKELLGALEFSERENEQIRTELKKAYGNVSELVQSQTRGFQLQLDQLQIRQSKLADLYIDGMLEKETYIYKKNELVEQETEIKERLKNINAGEQSALERVEHFVELVNNACLSYEWANPDEKREMIKIVTSNSTANGKTVLFKLNYTFQMVAERRDVPSGSPQRTAPRTVSALVCDLVAYFASRKDKEKDKEKVAA